jgi:hypothetical protein
MGRCLGRNVPEGKAQLILIDLGGGDAPLDDVAKQAVFLVIFYI